MALKLLESVWQYEQTSALQEVNVCRALDTKTNNQGQCAFPNPSAESTPVLPQPPFHGQFHCLAINKLHYSHFKAAPSLTAPFKSMQMMSTSIICTVRKKGLWTFWCRLNPLNSFLMEEEDKHTIRTLTHAASWYIPLNKVGNDVKQC